MTKLLAPLARLRGRLATGLRDERGIAAVEFAMLLPFMLTLYIGAVEVSQMIAADRKVTLASRTVADLAAQATTINAADLGNILKAASAVMTPYPESKLKVVVSQVKIDADQKATIVWSKKYNTGGAAPSNYHAVNSTVTVPDALKIANTHLIWGEVDFDYSPLVGGAPTDLFWKFTGTKKLTDKIYMRPRLSESVSCCT
jgi:Flp pilus assembly protein TadG